MNVHLLIGIVAAIVQLYAIVPYVKDILRRETRPNVVSWALWTLLQLIAIWIMVTSTDGFSWALFVLIAATLNTSFVVFLCLRGYGDKEFGFVEKACLAIALVAIGLYLVTKDAKLAIGFNIAADLVAAWPTIMKTAKDPRSEAWFPWFLVSVAAALGVISSEIRDAENLAFPVYLALVNGLIAAIAWFGQRRISKPVA